MHARIKPWPLEYITTAHTNCSTEANDFPDPAKGITAEPARN